MPQDNKQDVGLNVAVAPYGNPEAENAISSEKPESNVAVIVAVISLPWSIEPDAGEAVRV